MWSATKHLKISVIHLSTVYRWIIDKSHRRLCSPTTSTCVDNQWVNDNNNKLSSENYRRELTTTNSGWRTNSIVNIIGYWHIRCMGKTCSETTHYWFLSNSRSVTIETSGHTAIFRWDESFIDKCYWWQSIIWQMYRL
jgi:hypothetical protein